MATIDTVGDIVRVTVAAVYTDQVEMNDYHFVCAASGGTDSRLALATNIYNAYSATYRAVMSQDANLFGAKASTINRTPNPSPVTYTSVNPGSFPDRSMPTQVRPVLTINTAIAGRGFRGRAFLFTPADSFIDMTQLPNGALLLAINTMANVILVNQITGGTTWAPVIAHRHAGPPVTWTSTPVTTGVASGKFGTQRRSGNYGRTNPTPW